MKTVKTGPKVPLTVRVEPTRLEQLRTLAESQDTTVSALVDSAIDTILGTHGESAVLITKDDIAAFLPVAEAIGKPVPVALFLNIIRTQRP